MAPGPLLFWIGHLHPTTFSYTANMRQYGNETLLELDTEDAKAKDSTTDINAYSDTEYICLL